MNSELSGSKHEKTSDGYSPRRLCWKNACGRAYPFSRDHHFLLFLSSMKSRYHEKKAKNSKGRTPMWSSGGEYTPHDSLRSDFVNVLREKVHMTEQYICKLCGKPPDGTRGNVGVSFLDSECYFTWDTDCQWSNDSILQHGRLA